MYYLTASSRTGWTVRGKGDGPVPGVGSCGVEPVGGADPIVLRDSMEAP